jgi:hypothetical protein
VNIPAVRDAAVARRHMRHRHMPDHVIERVLDHPSLRRQESAAQSIPEAITPCAPQDQ